MTHQMATEQRSGVQRGNGRPIVRKAYQAPVVSKGPMLPTITAVDSAPISGAVT